LRGLLTRDFDHLLFAHGEPLIGGGRAALRRFLREAVALRKRAVAQRGPPDEPHVPDEDMGAQRAVVDGVARHDHVEQHEPDDDDAAAPQRIGRLGRCACRQQQSTAMARPHASRASASASSPAAPSRPPSARPR
jgi:hypothetical protein